MPEPYCGLPNRFGSASSYGLAIEASEWLATEYAEASGFNAKIARCFFFLGPYLHMDRRFEIVNFVKDACDGGEIKSENVRTVRVYLCAAYLAIGCGKFL